MCHAALTTAQYNCCGRSGCRVTAGLPLQLCNLLCILDTLNPYQLVPELLSLLEEMWSFPCQLGEALYFPVVLKATKKEKGKEEKAADISLSLGRELLQLRKNRAGIRNVSCSFFCKAVRGLGFLFPAARTLTIALQFQSDISTSLQTLHWKAHLWA